MGHRASRSGTTGGSNGVERRGRGRGNRRRCEWNFTILWDTRAGAVHFCRSSPVVCYELGPLPIGTLRCISLLGHGILMGMLLIDSRLMAESGFFQSSLLALATEPPTHSRRPHLPDTSLFGDDSNGYTSPQLEAFRFRLHVEAANSRGSLLLAHLAHLALLVLLSLHIHLIVARGRLLRGLNIVPSQWCRYSLFVVSNAPGSSSATKRVDIPSSWRWPSPVLGAQPGLLRVGG